MAAPSGPSREPPPWLEPLQSSLAEALIRLYGVAADPELSCWIGALLEALEQGRLSLPLSEAEAAALADSPLCRPGDGPLLIDNGQIGWRRWQCLRRTVLAALQERALSSGSGAAARAGSRLQARTLQPPQVLDPSQRRAVQAVLEHRLVLLQGGPGTGKTSTVAAMIAAVLEREPAARVHLAAPTGKAAARLRSATADAVPCSTLHRLLESRGDRFARNRRHPLALDLLVVDEVSMVDLALMAALLEALPAAARLVLVGDPAQLPPIAPGAVLLDLQQPTLREALGPAAITLTTTHRNAGAIAAVAADLRACLEAGSAEPNVLAAILPRLEALQPGDNLSWRRDPAGRLPDPVRRRLLEQLAALARIAAGCRPGADHDWRRLQALREGLLVLAPLRGGPWGVDTIHRMLLGEAAADPARWPEGLPVLCSRNLPDLGLANGDVGVLVGEPGAADRQLLFSASEPLWIHPAQLAGAAEPALALTVHKAQGSEAAEVIVLLPEPGQDPRLLYTALTRARQHAHLVLPA